MSVACRHQVKFTQSESGSPISAYLLDCLDEQSLLSLLSLSFWTYVHEPHGFNFILFHEISSSSSTPVWEGYLKIQYSTVMHRSLLDELYRYYLSLGNMAVKFFYERRTTGNHDIY